MASSAGAIAERHRSKVGRVSEPTDELGSEQIAWGKNAEEMGVRLVRLA